MLLHLPTFRKPQSELWRAGGGEKNADGVLTFPYAVYEPEVDAFVADLGRLGFIVPFDWTSWDEGRQLLAEPERIAQASLEDCVKLFTAIIRSARFSWGEGYHLDRGIFRLLLERLARLVGSS